MTRPALALLGLSFPAIAAAGGSAAEATSGPLSAYAVVLDGGLYKEAAQRSVALYRDQGLPSYGDGPWVMQSSELAVEGRAPWLVVAAIATREDVAQKLTVYLRNRNLEAELAPAPLKIARDVRVVAIDAVRGSGNGAPLHVYEVCLTSGTGECLGRATPDDDGYVVVPYLALQKDGRVALSVDVGEPWRCTVIDLGHVKRDSAVWLKAPVEATCYESGAERRQQRR